MASQVGSIVGRAQKFVFKTAIPVVKPRLEKFWTYAKVEMKPPSPSEFPQIMADVSKLQKALVAKNWKNVTTKEALVNTCVCLEVGFWFFIGEVIGRRSLIGYGRVPDAFSFGHF